MKREEFIEKILKEGFEYWNTYRGAEVYGKITYTDCYGECRDWEEWIICEKEARHVYMTNRELPNLDRCSACGEWYNIWNYEEAEKHDACCYEQIYFD